MASNDFYLLFARSSCYADKVRREHLIHVPRADVRFIRTYYHAQGISNAWIILCYGWRWYMGVNWVPVIEDMLQHRNCLLYDYFDHISPAEHERFNTITKERNEIIWKAVWGSDKIKEIQLLTRYDLMIIED